MDTESSKKKTRKQELAEESGSDSTVQSTMERGAEIYGQAEEAVSAAYDKTALAVSETYGQAEEAVSAAYDKTALAVSETYEKARNYSSENPGRTMLAALGIGLGLGFILGAGSRRWRTGIYVRPVVSAFSDIALRFFR